MQTSIFLAQLLGPLFLIVGASVLFNPGAFRTLAAEVVRSVTLVYLFGLMDFAAGLAIVLTHNVWRLALARAHHAGRLALAHPRRGARPDPGKDHALRRKASSAAGNSLRRRALSAVLSAWCFVITATCTQGAHP